MGALAIALVPAFAAPKGGISADMLDRLSATYQNTTADRALRNAAATVSLDKLALNAAARNTADNNFSHRVPSKGITNQERSGRCWLFTGLNVLRAQMMKEHDLPKLELSQCYNFFYDQLEKSNLFLQGMIDYADRPMDDKMVDWLFRHPLNDGGQYTGLADNLSKYGVVPSEVMAETFSSNNTDRLRSLISLRLREDGLRLRRMKADGASDKQLAVAKEEMLGEVYRMLARTLGVPPSEFTWTRRDSDGKVVSTKKYTPQSF